MQNFTNVKLEIFVPEMHVNQVRDALAEVGVGVIGNYDHCFAISQVQGSFRPLEGANPFDGKVGEITYSVESKIEVNCRRELVKEALAAIRRSHPYEEPLINIFPLVNHLFKD
ncbi:MAG: YqfO family protein [Anaerolineales bacterium]